MKIVVTKAQTFEIDPSKKYVCIISSNQEKWTEEQRSNLKESLASRNINLVFIPHGSKFKVMEVKDERKED